MRRLLFAFLLILSWFNVQSQDDKFIFSNLTEDDGLSYNVVNCFLKDSRGILWIGTYNGFSRFDGSNFYNYKIRRGGNSITSEVIHSLCEDKKGNIWGGTDNGVFCYLLKEDRFVNYEIASLNRTPTFGEIICDSKGDIWAKGPWSLFKYNREQDKFEELAKMSTRNDDIYYFRILKNGFAEDPSGNVFWMATSNGIASYNKNTHTITDSRTNPADSLFKERSTSALCLSPSGNFWYYNNDQSEIISFNPATQKILQRISLKDQNITGNGATIFEDRNKRLWFCTWNYDLLVIDLANNNAVTRIKHNSEDSRSVATGFFWDAFQDADNTIWLGTLAGISRCNPDRNIYKEYNLPELIPALKNTSIGYVMEDPDDKTIWLVTVSSLLINYNPATKKHTVIDIKKALPASNGEVPGNINPIRLYKNNIIIPASNGIWKFMKGSTRIVPFDILPPAYKDFKCFDVIFSGDTAAYYSNGRELLYWNRLTVYTEIIRFPPDSSIPAAGSIISGLMLAKDGKLWMNSSNDYIAVLNTNRKLERIKVNNEKEKGNGFVWSLDEDSKGNIWIIYRGFGLYRYNPVLKKFSFWNEPDGLPGNRLHKAIADGQDRIWSMFYNKVSVYIPEADKFFNFKIPYSESNYAYINFMARKADGNLLATIGNEVFEFYPERLLQIPPLKKPQISQLTASGKNISLYNHERIVLNPDENTIRFFFGTATMKEFFPHDLEYKLDGAENNWTTAGDKHEALYNNLPPGNYTFRVKVKGKNNTWQTADTTVSFTIKAPFYKTAWFIIFCILLFIASVYLFYRYRLSHKEKMMELQNKAQALEKEKAMVMYENLKQQLNPHFLFNSLTSLNSLIEAEPKAASGFLDSLSKTYRYILKSRDNETVSLADEILFAQNYIKLQQTRFEKGFEVEINIPEEYYHRKIVPVTLQNLIENAIKHNIIDEESPLVVNIYVEDGVLVVKNNLQKKKFVETSNRQGLANMQSLYNYLSSQSVTITEDDKYFTVKIPLI